MRIQKFFTTALAATLLWGQEPPSGGMNEPPRSASRRISSFGLNETSYRNGASSNAATLYNIIDFGQGRDGWLVYGQRYAPAGLNEADVGFKYRDTKKGNLYRATFATTEHPNGQLQSFGVDWDHRIATFTDRIGISILGDLARISGDPSHVDYSLGGNLKVKDHNIFFLRSHSDVSHAHHRIGYMNRDAADRRLFGGFIDLPDGKKPTFATFAGFSHHRFFNSYDFDRKRIDSGTILTFGNRPLDPYASRGMFEEQYRKFRHLPDADYIHIFPAIAFLDPAGTTSDVLRFNISYDGTSRDFPDAWLYNAFLHHNIALVQNVNYRNKNALWGGGAGYRFRRAPRSVFPVIRYQLGARDHQLTLDVFFTY